MTKTTPILLDRLAGALVEHDIKLKRTHLLQVAAKAFGFDNTHQFTAADKAGEFAPPAADYLGTIDSDLGTMAVLGSPQSGTFAVQLDRLCDDKTRQSNWVIAPTGEILDVTSVKDQIAPGKAGNAAGNMTSGSVECANCDWSGSEDECNEIKHYHERVSTGETVPAGECPKCGALTHLAKGPKAHAPVPEIDPEFPIYLTNGCCEHAHGDPEMMEYLGLDFGEFADEFYPLTEAESGYIAEDLISSDDGRMHALTGYSALYRGKKHVMPSIELAVGAEHDAPGHAEVRKQAEAYVKRILPKVEALDGNILLDSGIDDCVVIQILVPFTKVMEFGNLKAWFKHLAWIMVDPDLPGVITLEPVRHEGRDFAVSVEWIGEGEDGDYDPMQPGDRPLLRFDAQRNVGVVDNEWEDLNDGSYCTQVPAYCDRDIIEAMPRYLADRLDREGGAHPKRLLEQLSWTNVEAVREFIANEKKA